MKSMHIFLLLLVSGCGYKLGSAISDFKSEDPKKKAKAAEYFVRNPKEGVPRLIEWLEDPKLMESSKQALIDIGPPAHAKIVKLVHDNNREVAKASIEILYYWGKDVLPVIKKEYSDCSNIIAKTHYIRLMAESGDNEILAFLKSEFKTGNDMTPLNEIDEAISKLESKLEGKK